MSKKRYERKPVGYSGTEPTNQEIRHLLPRVLGQIGSMHKERPDLVLSSWPQLIGEKLAPMTKAVSFYEGILVVKVHNSTLYSLLAQHERGRLLRSLRERFPTIEIKNIVFRFG